MKSLRRITSQLPKLLVVVLFLTLAPAALASNTWYVDGVNGNDNNDCKTSQTACKTIGHAISLASAGDTIMVAPAIYTENLTINISLKIIGSGAATTIVDGGGVSTVFTISSTTANVVLSELTIRNGYTQGSGGGISNGGTLTVNDSIISGNTATDGGGIASGRSMKLTVNQTIISGNTATYSGGGIFTSGPLTVNRSTISGNSVTNGNGGGGGIFSEDYKKAINNSTISGNSVAGIFGLGGGIVTSGPLTITNSTVSGNSAAKTGGVAHFEGTLTINNSTISGNSGAGIEKGDAGQISLIIQNSIVANNSGGNCWLFRPITSNGYNLSSDNTCNFNGPGDMNNTKPGLGKLGYHGGPTQTIPLLEGSPTIDAGNPNGCTDGNGNLLKTDQRGKPRPDKEDTGGCDIGAFERQTD